MEVTNKMKELEELINDCDYNAIRKVEGHRHIIENNDEVLRWKRNPKIDDILEEMNLNDLIIELYSKGYDKNSELYRYFYRCMGVSLYMYWEVFYWEVNNEKSRKYEYSEDAFSRAEEIALDFLKTIKKRG